jgi:hypothetical protein
MRWKKERVRWKKRRNTMEMISLSLMIKMKRFQMTTMKIFLKLFLPTSMPFVTPKSLSPTVKCLISTLTTTMMSLKTTILTN